MVNHIDLSRMTPEVVKGEVLKATATNPLTIFPILGGVVLLAGWAIFDAGMLFLGTGIGAAVVGAGMFPVNFWGRFDSFKTAYFRKLREENERIAQEKLNEVEVFLDDRNFDQGARQVTKIQNSMESFEKVLARKFEPHEFAYARYHGVAEQVMVSTLTNLEQVVVMLEAIDSIDPDYIEGRIEEIGRICKGNEDNLTESLKEEMETLNERWDLREKALEDINKLLSTNERALTELEKIATGIATTNTRGGKNAEAELTSAIESLNSLSEEAQDIWG